MQTDTHLFITSPVSLQEAPAHLFLYSAIYLAYLRKWKSRIQLFKIAILKRWIISPVEKNKKKKRSVISFVCLFVLNELLDISGDPLCGPDPKVDTHRFNP